MRRRAVPAGPTWPAFPARATFAARPATARVVTAIPIEGQPCPLDLIDHTVTVVVITLEDLRLVLLVQGDVTIDELGQPIAFRLIDHRVVVGVEAAEPQVTAVGLAVTATPAPPTPAARATMAGR